MSAGRSACLCWTLLSVCLLASSSAGQTNITIEAGQTVSLPCKALSNDTVTVVEWRRIDPKEDEYVLLYRGKRFITVNQHPSFKNRVDLEDRQMKDGDVSLSLNNVTTEDSGTYECYVVQRKSNRRKRASDSISIIRLKVDPSGHTGGHQGDGGDKDGGDKDGGDKDGGDQDGSVGLIVGLMVPGVLLGIVGFLIFRRYRHRYQPPPLQSSDLLLV